MSVILYIWVDKFSYLSLTSVSQVGSRSTVIRTKYVFTSFVKFFEFFILFTEEKRSYQMLNRVKNNVQLQKVH